MNNSNERAKRNRKYQSTVARRLLFEYILSLIAYVAALIVLLLAGWSFCRNTDWPLINWLRPLLRFVRDYILGFGGAALLAGWLVITFHFISKPFHYLDEVVEAAATLANPKNEPIELPEALSYTENELNRVREKALESARIAKEAEQRKNDLVMYLAHDLKTPLTSVIGYLTLLCEERQISEELQQKYLSIALEKAEHLEDLINEFFEITRFNLSHITLEYSRVNLTRMLEQLTFEFQPMFSEKNLSCRLEIAPDTMLSCDANKLQRVFDNLLKNAVNYSFPDSTIRIVVTKEADSLTIQFINNGNTIPQEKLARIFEQFYRLDTARSSASGGAGLGLAIAREVVELHGGSILAKSENESIEFTIKLPVS